MTTPKALSIQTLNGDDIIAFPPSPNATVLVLCLPNGKHAHWLREWIRHYDVMEQQPQPEQPVFVSPRLDRSDIGTDGFGN